MSHLSEVRTSLHELLACYESCEGRGSDDYYKPSIVHPMADGKYLSAMAMLRKAELIDEATYSSKVEIAIERLASLNLADSPDEEACWGLGFVFRDAPVNEPYVITTSLVANGLLDVHSDRSDLLASCAARWLQRSAPRTSVRYRDGKLDLHVFSEHIRELITNVAVSGSALLHRAGQSVHAEAVSGWTRSQFSPSFGWKYAPNNPRVDLLHQCYILNALADLDGVASVDDEALRILGLFRGGKGFLDKLSVVENAEIATYAAQASTECFVQISSQQWLVRHAQVARNWSIGELLLLVSRLAIEGRERTTWRALLKRILLIAHRLIRRDIARADSKPIATSFRQSMHLAHGIASALYSLRSLRRMEETTV